MAKLILRRRYLKELERWRGNKGFIKVISGIHRCGKSTLMAQFIDTLKISGIAEQNILYLNMELYGNKEYCNSDAAYQLFKNKLTGHSSYLLIDEVQYISDWPRIIRSALEEFDTDIYITGSNSQLLSSDIYGRLSGRAVKIEVFPFSLAEFAEYNQISDRKAAFGAYLLRGGMPNILPSDDDLTANDKLIGTYSTIVLKDMTERNGIRNASLFDRLSKFLFSSVGSMVSPTSIAREIGIGDTNTIGSYLGYLSDAFIFYKVQRYDIKGKKLLMNINKYYCADIGMRNAILNTPGKDIEHIIENLVYLELRQRQYSVEVGMFADSEIDFIARRSGRTEYYQVTSTMLQDDVRERELRPLLKIKDNYPKYVLSLDDVPIPDFDGIIHMNVIDFLMGKGLGPE